MYPAFDAGQIPGTVEEVRFIAETIEFAVLEALNSQASPDLIRSLSAEAFVLLRSLPSPSIPLEAGKQ